MIKINKGEAPKELLDKEQELLVTLKALYDANPTGYSSGSVKFEFTGDYRIDAVKKALKDCQNNKCCFSEAKFDRDYPNVEHFRPKGKVDPYPKGAPDYPGYYWLAYSWENLFFCKAAINSSDKRNYFPLELGSTRNRSHHDDFKEKPLLIDVSKEDPRDFIRFRNDEPYGVDSRGKFNVEFFNLRHPDLAEARRERFKILKVIKEAVEKLIDGGIDKIQCKDLIDKLRIAMEPDQEFSSMAIDFLQDWPHFE